MDELKRRAIIHTDSPKIKDFFGSNLPESVTDINKWTQKNKALFKEERGQINIGLGNSECLEFFNKNILGFDELKIVK